MKAAVFDGSATMDVRELTPKAPAADEVLIRIDSATICGTDLHILEGKFEARPPVVLGHEFAGFIEDAGAEVDNCMVGDLVSVEPHIYCGCCKPCRIGKPHLCLDRLAWGINIDGGFAQYTTVRKDLVYKVPEGVGSELAALGELMGCVMNGIDRVQVGLGDTVLILGGGAAGIMLGRLAQHRGAARVMFSDPSPTRRDAIAGFGFDEIFDPSTQDLHGEVSRRTGGLGADAVIDAAGVPETAAAAVELACYAGRILFFGVMAPGRRIQIEPNRVFARELTIRGSIRNPFTHHRVMALLPKLALDGIVTHRFGLDEMNAALDCARRGEGLKICMKPNGAVGG